MNRIIHFEINAEDPEKIAAFYTKVFNWSINKWEGLIEYWLATTGNKNEAGIDGGIMRKEEGVPRTVNTIGVKSVDEFIERIINSGGTVLRPKSAVPGVEYFAYCTDPEGTVFGIMENDPEAKQH